MAGRRTDSIILVYVPSGGGKSALISIPRDSYVPIPGHGSNKINAAFAFGGPKLLVETVEQVTDLRIDGYLEVGFAGFVGVVDSLGGVDICVPFHMNDPKAHINLEKGCQTLERPERPRLRPGPLLRPPRRHRPGRSASGSSSARS